MKHIFICWLACMLSGALGMVGQRYIPSDSLWFVGLGFLMGTIGGCLGWYYAEKLRD